MCIYGVCVHVYVIVPACRRCSAPACPELLALRAFSPQNTKKEHAAWSVGTFSSSCIFVFFLLRSFFPAFDFSFDLRFLAYAYVGHHLVRDWVSIIRLLTFWLSFVCLFRVDPLFA